MNKKVLTVVLVVLLAMTSVFAYRGEMKVGVNLGAGLDGCGRTFDDNTAEVEMFGGFYGAGTFQFGLTDSLYAKAEIGINTFSKKVIAKTGQDAMSYTGFDRKANVLISAALVYDIPIGKILDIDLQIGVDSIIGSPCLLADGNNVAIGLGLGTGLYVNITEQLALSLNSKLAIYFANTDATFKKVVADGDYSLIGVQNNIGVTYSL